MGNAQLIRFIGRKNLFFGTCKKRQTQKDFNFKNKNILLIIMIEAENVHEKELSNAIENLSLEPKAGEAQSTKVDILLNATGNVPIMKKKKWAVDQEKPISWIMKFIHKYLKLDPEDKLFLYVNQTFAPSPDQIVKNLYECYGTNGKLILYYCRSQAWG